jgi:hypothetical protein
MGASVRRGNATGGAQPYSQTTGNLKMELSGDTACVGQKNEERSLRRFSDFEGKAAILTLVVMLSSFMAKYYTAHVCQLLLYGQIFGNQYSPTNWFQSICSSTL